ncbi:hypothetical protein BZG36_00135 [Bifiguratus adelaidae]|uniref:Phospholipid/glycerol acyltransferase domain-containing protein n=1 Tax=Bifiguratus adelaidae TaxID=1938954 RepID=A0A261Y8I7_9FUNG|nr:hypothetical protein BZG36_00135 [Bifiguratus adelaidae]
MGKAEDGMGGTKAILPVKEGNNLIFKGVVLEDGNLKDGYWNITEKDPQNFANDPMAFMLSMNAFYQGKGWRSHKDYIGPPYYYEGFTEEIRHRVLTSSRVQKCIRNLAAQQLQSMTKMSKASQDPKEAKQAAKAQRRKEQALLNELNAAAKDIAVKCFSHMESLRTLRFFAFTINNILVRLYHQGIHIRESDFNELKQVALECARSKRSLILLPSHKSHIDYLVVSYVFFRLGLQIPHIAAGDNLDMPIVGSLLRTSGAFFIRRQWGDDQLYKGVLEEYINVLLSEGYNIEAFVEGTRSRTGKLLPPKLGILKIVVDAVLNETAKDAMIVPISIGYDKVIETETYVNELLGRPKEKESIWALMTQSRLLQLKWGRVDLRVHKPYSLRDWIDEQISRRTSTEKVFDPVRSFNDKAVLIKSIGYRILADINSVSVIMPTALVGTVLLTLRGRGVGRSELIRRVTWLREQILNNGGNVAEFYGMPISDVVDRSVAIMKDLVGQRLSTEVIEPTFYALKRFELSLYRNSVLHLFIEEAIISIALYTVVKKGGLKESQRLTRQELLDLVFFLSSLLKQEFIFRPGTVEDNTDKAIGRLVANDVIEIGQDGSIGLTEAERIRGRENFDFYCFLLWPFVETYWLAAVSVFTIAPQTDTDQGPAENVLKVEEKVFTERIQVLGKTLYYQGDLSYLEAVNKETLKNAFIRLEQQGIISAEKDASVKSLLITLNSAYVPFRQNGAIVPDGKLWRLVERVSVFRREGKNRRDNATVSLRVLRQADVIGQMNLESLTKMQKKGSLLEESKSTLAKL